MRRDFQRRVKKPTPAINAMKRYLGPTVEQTIPSAMTVGNLTTHQRYSTASISYKHTMRFIVSITVDKPLTFIEGFPGLGLTLNLVPCGKVSDL